jgi:hypothetical protein
MPPPAESENSKSCEAPAGAWLCSRPPGRQPKPQAGEYCDAADESGSSPTAMTGTKHQAKKATACQAKKPNEKGSHHRNGIRKHWWTKGYHLPFASRANRAALNRSRLSLKAVARAT